MKLRHFFSAVVSMLGSRPHRQKPADDALGRMEHDASVLIARIYAGKSWTRRAMRGRMSQPRWGKAYQLLTEAHVLDEEGAVRAANWEVADALVRDRVQTWRRLQWTGARYTSPVG